MKFALLVEIEIKNDEATREAGRQAITGILALALEGPLQSIPWVVDHMISEVEVLNV